MSPKKVLPETTNGVVGKNLPLIQDSLVISSTEGFIPQ